MTSCDSCASTENEETETEKSDNSNSESSICIPLVPFQSNNLENINTIQFLDASKGVVAFIDKFGKVFAPVKYDMNGNIEKLTRKYLEDPDDYKFLQAMILSEKAQGKDVATDALMWLRRALQFFHRFIELLVEDSKNETKTESISKYVKASYSDTLQRYHGWMAHKLFNLLYKMCPTRSQIFVTLAINEETTEEEIINELEVYNGHLGIVLLELVRFYDINELENHARV